MERMRVREVGGSRSEEGAEEIEAAASSAVGGADAASSAMAGSSGLWWAGGGEGIRVFGGPRLPESWWIGCDERRRRARIPKPSDPFLKGL
jgi:hypothetical protein